MHLIKLDAIDSTNTYLKSLSLKQKLEDFTVVVAEKKTKGRGQMGTNWQAETSKNVTFSVFKDVSFLKNNQQFYVSMAVSLAIVKALNELHIPKIKIKWPNDILHRGQKLGGILIESRALTEDEFFFAIGFGINVHMRDEEFGHIEQPATSLQQITDGPVDRTELLVESIIAVSRAIREFDAAGAAELVEAFSRYDAYQGKPVEVVAGARRVEGVNLGITEDGQLKLQTGEGVEIHAAAEISLRPRSE